MRVDKIDNSTNFKMAFAIDKRALPKLQELPTETIRKINKLGDNVTDLLYYVVCVDKDLNFSIRSLDHSDDTDYLAAFRETQKLLGRAYNIVESDGGGETVRGGFYPDVPPTFTRKYGKSAKEEYNKFKALDQYGQIEQYTKMLEEFKLEESARREAEEDAERVREEIKRTAQEEKDEAIKRLLGFYGCEPPQPVAEKPVKRTFFQRLFHK